MNDVESYEGKFEIYKNGVLVDTIFNRVTDQFLNNLVKNLTGETTTAMDIKYLALGNSTTVYDDKLGNEVFRTFYSIAPSRVGVGEVRTEFVILPAEAVGDIKEIGIFGGNATNQSDSGFLITRVPWDYEKTGSDEFTIVRTDKIRRG